MTEFPEIIKDGDIELRRQKPTFEMAKETFETIDRNREYLGPWLPWVNGTRTLEDMYEGLKHVFENEIFWRIFLDSRFVGCISFVNKNKKAKWLEIGYWIDSAASGKGVMTRAVQLLEKAAFENSDNWNMIQIRCNPENLPSSGIPRRLGYHLDGEIRCDTVDSNGELRNTLVFSKFKSEWKR